jgi:hypothetical protein
MVGLFFLPFSLLANFNFLLEEFFMKLSWWSIEIPWAHGARHGKHSR